METCDLQTALFFFHEVYYRVVYRVLTVLLVVIKLVNGTSAPVTASCTALETILIEAHLHVCVLEKQRSRQGGQLEGFLFVGE